MQTFKKYYSKEARKKAKKKKKKSKVLGYYLAYGWPNDAMCDGDGRD